MPTLAVTSLIRDEDSLSTMVDFAIENGFKAVELNGRHHCVEKLFPKMISTIFAGSRMRTVSHLISTTTTDAMPGSHSASVWQDTLESFKRNLEMTKELGGRVVVLHPGKIDVPDSGIS